MRFSFVRKRAQMAPVEWTLFSVSRQALTIGPGISFLIFLTTSVMRHRPDIVDKDNRCDDIAAEHIQDNYDFVIVGGGSAGTVLANRLSENPDWSILLLEAGPDEIPLSDIPIMFPLTQGSTLDWGFKTEPSDHYCKAMINGACNWPRAKVLGGCSTMNAMMYIRGNRRDYDHWAKMGNPGWAYEDVLPYFKKSEDIQIPALKGDFYHGSGGYLTVEDFRYHSPLADWFLETAKEFGFKIIDLNGENQTGFSLTPGTLRNGLRCSTAKAYLRPACARSNLHVSLLTHATRILIDPTSYAAYGVEFLKLGAKKEVYATKEVLLSAGSIQSPQLLMLSGVGPADHLQDNDIEVAVNAPGVGRNLQDHVAAGGITFLFEPPPYADGPRGCSFALPKVFDTENLDEFNEQERGQMYWLPECEVMGFVPTVYANASDDYPDVQIFMAAYADNTDGGLFSKRITGLKDKVFAEMFEPYLYQDAFSVLPLLMRPRSRGYLELKDKDPLSKPVIYPNYFSDPYDIKVLVEGMKFSYSLGMSKTMRGYKSRFNPLKMPGCEDYPMASDSYWECLARHYSLTIYHPSGTCKMGPKSDPLAVVDHRLKVYGVPNLRVIDASIFPTIPTGNTNAPVVMIAEKTADMIKSDWAGREDVVFMPNRKQPDLDYW